MEDLLLVLKTQLAASYRTNIYGHVILWRFVGDCDWLTSAGVCALRSGEKGIQKGPQLDYATIFEIFYDMDALTASSFRFNGPEQMPFTAAPLAALPPILPLPALLSLLTRISLWGPVPGVVAIISYVRLRDFGSFASVGVGWLAPVVKLRWPRLCRCSFGIAKFSYNVHSCVRCMWLRFSCGNLCRNCQKKPPKKLKIQPKMHNFEQTTKRSIGKIGNFANFSENEVFRRIESSGHLWFGQKAGHIALDLLRLPSPTLPAAVRSSSG